MFSAKEPRRGACSPRTGPQRADPRRPHRRSPRGASDPSAWCDRANRRPDAGSLARINADDVERRVVAVLGRELSRPELLIALHHKGGKTNMPKLNGAPGTYGASALYAAARPSSGSIHWLPAPGRPTNSCARIPVTSGWSWISPNAPASPRLTAQQFERGAGGRAHPRSRHQFRDCRPPIDSFRIVRSIVVAMGWGRGRYGLA